MTRRFLFSVLAACSGGLLFGCDIGAIAGAAPGLRTSFGLSASALGFAVSSAVLGTIVGSMAAGLCADLLGRRAVLCISGGIYAAAILFAVSAHHLPLFAACRFLCGLAIGLISVGAPMYLAEIAPPRWRGRIVGLFQLSLSLGVVLAFLLGYLLSAHMQSGLVWRLLLSAGLFPCLLGELCLLQAAPSPRWLAAKGRLSEARAALVMLGSEDPGAEAASMAASLKTAADSTQPRLFSRQYLRPILLATSIAVFNQLTGVNALLYYILDVFHDLGSGRLNGRADALTLATLSLLVTALAVFIIDKAGRRPLLLIGAAGMGLCLALLPLVRHLRWPASTVVVLLAAYNAFFGFSQGAVIWVYLSEIFPLPVRARGQSLGSTVHWITNAIVVGSFPVLSSYAGEKIFVGLASIMALQFLTVFLFYPETRGNSLESLTQAAAIN